VTTPEPTREDRRSAPALLALAPWQRAVQTAIRDVAELARLLELEPAALTGLASPGFPLRVPRGFVARMRKRDPHDPLLRQVFPAAEESSTVRGFGPDPVGEHARARRGLIQKYAGRALLIAAGTCPIHCRYCFRREFPYAAQLAARADWQPALAELERLEDIDEVILSGGDPLSLSNRRLGEVLARLAGTSVGTVRIHTRFPIVIPERVDEGLLEQLRRTRLRTVVVVHSNHANELDDGVGAALAALKPVVTALLNQSVLLRGVNDDAAALAALSRRLFACGVLPYYLHLLDRVAGAAHFDVDATAGRALIAALRKRLPGYLVPRLVREVPGELSKTPIA
jgi:L-lysine 2,3-aminomutase